MDVSEEKAVWFAMRATYRREMEAKKLLAAESIESFVPMRYVLAKNKKKYQLVPVIHNLIFVHARPSHIHQIKKGIQFLQYMVDKRSGQKIVVPDGQMKRFIAVAGTYHEHLLYFSPEEVNFSKGTKVRICGGEYEGYEGIFIKVKGARDKRVVVQVQGVIAVALATIHPDLIEPIIES